MGFAEYHTTGQGLEDFVALVRASVFFVTRAVAGLRAVLSRPLCNTYLSLQNNAEVPCAVCQRTAVGSRTLLVPGTTQCPSGFAPDYAGYLFTSVGVRNDYVCIDANAEGGGSTGNEGGTRIYPVEVDSLKGPQGYTGNYEVTCVVCGSVASNGAIHTRWGRTVREYEVDLPAIAIFHRLLAGRCLPSVRSLAHRYAIPRPRQSTRAMWRRPQRIPPMVDLDFCACPRRLAMRASSHRMNRARTSVRSDGSRA